MDDNSPTLSASGELFFAGRGCFADDNICFIAAGRLVTGPPGVSLPPVGRAHYQSGSARGCVGGPSGGLAGAANSISSPLGLGFVSVQMFPTAGPAFVGPKDSRLRQFYRGGVAFRL